MVTRKKYNVNVQSPPVTGKVGYDGRVSLHALVRCLQCKALVNAGSDRDDHTRWHNQINALATAVAQFTQPELPTEPPPPF